MIYRMVMGDLLRFVAIYLVFVMGFSQGKYFFKPMFENTFTRKKRLYFSRLGTSSVQKSLFSAYYVIFLSFDNPNTPEGVDDSVSNPMPSPMESIMAMFLMSLTSFSDYYGAFDRTDHEIEAKVSFHRRTFKGEPNCGL